MLPEINLETDVYGQIRGEFLCDSLVLVPFSVFGGIDDLL